MLNTCLLFAESHNLVFNAGKTQLIAFSRTAPAVTASTFFSFCGQQLKFCKTVTHLGHILSCDLSDDPAIIAVKKISVGRLTLCYILSPAVTPTLNQICLEVSVFLCMALHFGWRPPKSSGL